MNSKVENGKVVKNMEMICMSRRLCGVLKIIFGLKNTLKMAELYFTTMITFHKSMYHVLDLYFEMKS